MRAAVAIVLVLLLVSPALSLPTGAPPEACSTVTSSHLSVPQTSTNPYGIDLGIFDDGSGGFSYLPGKTYRCEFVHSLTHFLAWQLKETSIIIVIPSNIIYRIAESSVMNATYTTKSKWLLVQQEVRRAMG